MTYALLLERLFSINRESGMKLGLQNPYALDSLSGFPSAGFDSIHVAGSNGKGSVTTKIAAGFQAAGFRTGLYTSPHIDTFRERIQINQQMISEEQVMEHLLPLYEMAQEQNILSTFFELTTALAFRWFSQEQVPVAVIETGLGGRLDATNILVPKLSIITSISLEHTQILGDSIETITREKCGIIKPGVPILIGPRVPLNIVQEYAQRHLSPLIQVAGTFSDYHEENEAIARRAMELLQLPPQAIAKGITALPPCRLEILARTSRADLFPEAVIFDVAHNPDGFFQLLKAIKKRFPHHPLRFLIGMSKDKEIKNCLNRLIDAAAHIHLVEASNERAAPTALLKQALLELGMAEQQITCEDSIHSGIQNAMRQATLNGELLIVCGTFYIMAAAKSIQHLIRN